MTEKTSRVALGSQHNYGAVSDALARYVSRLYSAGTIITCFSIVYLPVTLLLASRKHLWNDELFTYYIARLGSSSQIWSALLTAADQNPPPFYWLTHLSMKLPVGTFIGIRLPEILGFWLAGVCLIVFLSRHIPLAHGLLAALILLTSGAYSYAFEARPYAIVVGFAALALLSWQRCEGARIGMWAISLAFALALGVSMHYYSVLVFLPLAAGEIIRSWLEGRPRWPVWAAFITGALPLIAYLPLIRRAATYTGTFWAQPRISAINDFFLVMLVPAFPPVAALALGVSAEYLMRIPSRHRARVEAAIRPPLSEVVAVFGFIALPAIAVAGAFAITGAYTHRYALAGVIGIAVLGSWMLSAVFRAAPIAGLAAAAVMSVFFMGKEVAAASGMRMFANHDALIRFLDQPLARRYNVAIADPHLFFELSDQAVTLRSRVFYVADRKLALKHVHTDAVDRGVIDMARLAPLQVKTLSEVVESGSPFLIYGYPAPNGWDWLVEELSSLHMPMSVIGSMDGRLLLLVNSRTSATASATECAHCERARLGPIYAGRL